MLILFAIAILDGVIIARRLINKGPRKVTTRWIIFGILYGFLALLTIGSGLSLSVGAVIVFGPIVLWVLRVVLFGSREYQRKNTSCH